MQSNLTSPELEIILGNSNKRFSGVTSTMLQTLAIQKKIANVRVLGQHHLPDQKLSISFFDLIIRSVESRNYKKPVIFHARRNDEMIQALMLKWIFRFNLKIIFTSTAQRHHSRFTRFLMNNMDAIITTCKAAKNYIRAPIKAIIPHGIEIKRFFPAADKEDLWNELALGGTHGIGIFGRVRPSKGIHLFVDACIQLMPATPEYTAIIVGAIAPSDKEYVNHLKEKIENANLSQRILFLGEQDFDQIPVLMRAVSICCSLSLNEGFGLTPLEAMASKTAVITTPAGAWPDIIDHKKNGLISSSFEVSDIIKNMRTLINNSKLRIQLSNNGYSEVIQDYTVENEALALINLYRNIQNSNEA